MQLFLVPEAGDAIQIEGDQATVGRREGCELHLQDNSVSRAHARLEKRGDGWLVVDNSSVNGTFVNEQRIEQPTKLAGGDEVRFGNLSFRVQLRDDTGGGETMQLAAPRVLRFDEPAPTRRPPVPPPPSPLSRSGELPTIHARPAAAAKPGTAATMAEEEARNLLGLPTGAAVSEGRRRYEQMYNDYQVRVTNAPTAALRRMYQRNLNELKQAFEALFPGQKLP